MEKTKEQIKEMNEDQFYKWFIDTAGYNKYIYPRNGGGYQIRIGAKLFKNADIFTLRQIVEKFVGREISE